MIYSYNSICYLLYLSGKWIAITCALSYTAGILGYYASMQMIKKQRLETQSARNAIQPFLLAERDRQ